MTLVRQRTLLSVPLFGNVRQYGYYFVDLLVGGPEPQRVSVIVDTGSSVCAFPCRGCEHCGHHMDPLFDLASSRSATWEPCRDKASLQSSHGSGCLCEAEGGPYCTYALHYTEGSSLQGFWFRDEVRFGDDPTLPPFSAHLGCHLAERKLFYTQTANGILGLAPGSPHFPNVVQAFAAVGSQPAEPVFSICLAESGGRLDVGSQALNRSAGSTRWIRMEASSLYVVQITGMFRQLRNGLLKRCGPPLWRILL